ncbi:MAG: hypothetical protein EAZ85_06510 [Bacteroidetes bacterium]|nr:MAG: hypothetical protein EAZ85_06510 [Bacteroidota bacterium]TAG90483.1 MAG: hypothetical protein EAZ20_04190 [Bacteroidota bacterium]
MFFKKIISIIFLCLFNYCLKAQDLGNSPYSQLAFGDIQPAGGVQQTSMGGSVSFVMPFTLNTANPASLSRLSKSKNTIYEAAATLQLKEVAQSNSNQRTFAGSLAYIAAAFPVSKMVAMSIGLRPVSSVNYQNQITQQVTNSDFLTDVSYTGKGGLNTIYVDVAVDLTKNFRADTLKHRLALGLRTGYVFGGITEETSVKIRTGQLNDDVKSVFFQRNRWNDLLFEPALLYTYKLGKDQKLNFGATATIGKNMQTLRFLSVQRFAGAGSTLIGADTLFRESVNKVYYPQKLNFGVSWEKDLKWALTADFFTQNWKPDPNFNPNEKITTSWGASVGVQYIPDFYAVKKIFFKRNFYRAGFVYQQTPIMTNGQNITDMALNLGVGIPIVVQKSFSIVNLGFSFGQRGTLNNGLVRENYMRIQVGVTINDRWFEKFKLN